MTWFQAGNKTTFTYLKSDRKHLQNPHEYFRHSTKVSLTLKLSSSFTAWYIDDDFKIVAIKYLAWQFPCSVLYEECEGVPLCCHYLAIQFFYKNVPGVTYNQESQSINLCIRFNQNVTRRIWSRDECMCHGSKKQWQVLNRAVPVAAGPMGSMSDYVIHSYSGGTTFDHYRVSWYHDLGFRIFTPCVSIDAVLKQVTKLCEPLIAQYYYP